MNIGIISAASSNYWGASGADAARNLLPGSEDAAAGAVNGMDDRKRNPITGRVEKSECQTCKNRKYVDGSNEADVSFKSPAHIDPGNSAAAVLSHEYEHVANAIAEGNEEGKELVGVSVTLKTAVCPECGRVYVAGGETYSAIRTTKEIKNPFSKQQDNLKSLMLSGSNMDLNT